MSDLIAEADATKGGIEEATASIENVTIASVQHQQVAAQQQQQQALQKNTNFESNLFGFDNNDAPPAAADRGIPDPSPMAAPLGGMMGGGSQDGGLPAPESFGTTQSFESGLPPQVEVPLAQSSNDGSMMNQPAFSPQGGLGGFPEITPSGSVDSGFPPQEIAPNASGGSNPFGDEPSVVTAHSQSQAPEQAPAEMAPPAAAQPPPAQQQQYQQPPPPAGGGGGGGDPGMAIPTPTPPQQYQQVLPPGGPAPADNGMAIPTPNPGQAYHQMPPPGQQQPLPQAMPTPQQQQAYMMQNQQLTPIATPNYGLARPSVDHNRKESVGGFGGDFVMGGFAPPTGAGGVYGAAAAASAHVEASSAAPTPPPDNSAAVAQLEELKKKYKGAQEIASAAAASHIKLAQEADELRGDADKAEANARSLRASADEKKKGRFGGSNKKKALNVSE